jgi:FkbH-like protein
MSAQDADFALLKKADSTLAQLTRALTQLEAQHTGRRLSIGVSSSATVDLLGLHLRKQGLLNGTRIDIHQGNYDDPIGDVDRFLSAGVEQMVLLPFFDKLLPAFEARIEGMAAAAIDAKEAEIRQRYRLVFDKAQALRSVYLGSFHRMGQATDVSAKDAVDTVLARFNQALREESAAFSNVRVIDTEEVLRTIGQAAAFDARFYFRSQAPYTGLFFHEFSRRIALAARGFGAHFYKVLVLDCDNTLWGGVVGEDLLSGIQLGPHEYPGNIFWRMQHEFSTLERNGVLLCLCSKNNPADIDEVLQKHPDMVLRDAQIVIRKVNWNDKASNLRELASELNVGLDSMVFLDDSAFECEAVRQQLPMVKAILVPPALSDYPRAVQEIKELFMAGGVSADSRAKTEQYRLRAGAEELKAQFDSQDAYLESLQLKVTLSLNAVASIARISELSMKSNQFNLTTRRYSEAEIRHMTLAPEYAVYSLTVADKFGNSGLTGVVVMRYSAGVAQVDNFFMSCRVIGRGVEMSLWARIRADALARGCSELRAEFVPSAKNAQVADFYERIGLPLVADLGPAGKQYGVLTGAFAPPETSWIEITHAE